MTLFATQGRTEEDPIVEGEGIYLRYPAIADFEAWAGLREQSREFLTPWEPVWPKDDLTRAAFRRRIRRYQRDIREDAAYPFIIFRSEDDELLGACTLSNIRRGVTQAASLGYWIGEPFIQQGIMTRAVRALIPFVFETLRLHRLEAACLPDNLASRKLLARVGFTEEGLARNYLRINGKWQDHVLFAILETDPRP